MILDLPVIFAVLFFFCKFNFNLDCDNLNWTMIGRKACSTTLVKVQAPPSQATETPDTILSIVFLVCKNRMQELKWQQSCIATGCLYVFLIRDDRLNRLELYTE